MSHALVVRPRAEADIADAFAWYETQRAGLGSELLEEIELGLNRITANPHHYQAVHGDVRRAIIRRFPYSLYFLADDRAVTVIAVLHHRRDPASWRGRS